MVNRSSVGETSLNDISAKTICGLILEAPTADVVEVVRCKDCSFGEVDAEFDSVMCFCRNAPWDNKYIDYFTMSPNDYCSYGKRKGGC